MEKIIYNVSETARMIGVDRSTLNRWIKDKQVNPRIKPNGKKFFTKEDIENILKGK